MYFSSLSRGDVAIKIHIWCQVENGMVAFSIFIRWVLPAKCSFCSWAWNATAGGFYVSPKVPCRPSLPCNLAATRWKKYNIVKYSSKCCKTSRCCCNFTQEAGSESKAAVGDGKFYTGTDIKGSLPNKHRRKAARSKMRWDSSTDRGCFACVRVCVCSPAALSLRTSLFPTPQWLNVHTHTHKQRHTTQTW